MLQTERQQAQFSGERLLFDLMISNEGADKFIFTAKRQTADGLTVPIPNLPTKALTLTEIEPLVADCIANSDQPFVEFSLPKEMLSLPVDRWDYFGSALGEMFSVVVRLRERSAGILPKQLLTNWRAVSQRIRDKFSSGEKPTAYWLPNDRLNLMPHVMDGNYGACIAFAAPPEDKTLRDILFGGVPYAVWPRQLPAEGQKFRRKLNAKLGAAHLNGFPKRMRDLRKAGDAGAEMTLLWDEAPQQTRLEKFTPLD
jgi:hypothetical protein